MNQVESSASGCAASFIAMIFNLVQVSDLFTAFLCGICGAAGGWIFKFLIDQIKKIHEKNS